MGKNNIGSQSAAAIAKALETNTTLQLLSLGSNDIGRESAVAIAKAPVTNTTLQEMYFDDNGRRWE